MSARSCRNAAHRHSETAHDVQKGLWAAPLSSPPHLFDPHFKLIDDASNITRPCCHPSSSSHTGTGADARRPSRIPHDRQVSRRPHPIEQVLTHIIFKTRKSRISPDPGRYYLGSANATRLTILSYKGRNPVKLEPGLSLFIPILHSIQKVDMRERALPLERLGAFTSDNVCQNSLRV